MNSSFAMFILILVLICTSWHRPHVCSAEPSLGTAIDVSDSSSGTSGGSSAAHVNCALLASAEARALSSELVWEARTISKIAVHAYQLANVTVRLVRALKGSPEVRSFPLHSIYAPITSALRPLRSRGHFDRLILIRHQSSDSVMTWNMFDVHSSLCNWPMV